MKSFIHILEKIESQSKYISDSLFPLSFLLIGFWLILMAYGSILVAMESLFSLVVSLKYGDAHVMQTVLTLIAVPYVHFICKNLGSKCLEVANETIMK